jgi:hypothetical protein
MACTSLEQSKALVLEALDTLFYKRGRAGADEILVESAKPFRANVDPNEQNFVDAFNIQMLSLTRSADP